MMCMKATSTSMKLVEMNGHKVQALIDTGSDISAVRESVFKKLNVEQRTSINKSFACVGASSINTNRFFDGSLIIDGEEFKTRIYIVSDKDIPVEAVIGNELLYEVNLTMTKGEIKLTRNESDAEKETKQLMCMMITEKDDNETPEAIQTMIDNYQPKHPNVNSNVQMTIRLTDDIPVYEQPRRLPFAHCEKVEKQIADWIKDGVVKRGSSPYACNVLVKPKKDGTDRVCIDYRPLKSDIQTHQLTTS